MSATNAVSRRTLPPRLSKTKAVEWKGSMRLPAADRLELLIAVTCLAAILGMTGCDRETTSPPAPQVAPAQQVVGSGSMSAADYLNHGCKYLEKGQHDKAIADFTTAIRLDPRLLKAYMDRAGAYAAQDHLDLAVADYSSVIQLAPQDPLARWAVYMRAQMYSLQGEHDKAIADYTEMVRLDPRDPVSLCNRGDAYAAKKDFNKALADFTEAIRVEPNDHTGYNSLAWLWATCAEAKFRDGKKAVEYATKACELTSWADASQFDTLAAAYADIGRFEEAVKWEKKAIESPNYPKEELQEARLRLKLYEEGKPFRDE